MGPLSFSDRASQRRLVRFLAVGGSTALLQLGILWILKKRLPETWAFSLSWVLSTGAHYLANRFWALPSRRADTARQLGEYLGTVALSYAINLAAFRLGRDWIGLNVMWATACAIPPSTVAVFLLLNFRVFRAPGPPPP